ncbi:ATP-grasp fold amidoligase family protein [Sodalis sp. dw_96]|uniref:ATP-grasp fold amidoligase family protein n=1 Tax=Sodalis sp. dw_96 TaxID=2719794 RepID=UPI001BD46A64|nr:ATP-grasp fold amidoligase family protein [Sodalis sp. dw_96]
MLNPLAKQATKLLPDVLYHQIKYARVFKKWPNTVRPKTFSEKIIIRNFKPKSIYTELADKLKVRDYIVSTIGAQYLIKLHAVCSVLTRSIYDNLPNSFVIKANHGCGFNRIVYDKTKITFDELSQESKQWMDINYYKTTRERHYKTITPCIMIEELLLDKGKVPNDIKFHCFNRQGEMHIFIQVDYDRFGVHRRDIFDTQWNRTDIRMGLPNSPEPMAAPENLAEMLSLAKRIAEQFSYLRIDFYEAGGKIYFGELTFTPGGGLCKMYPQETQRQWGDFFTD